jgi:transcriptional regulator with XRE-family HTH domain
MYIDYKLLGKNIAKRRKELKLKQYEVCERADINEKYLSCIETARSIPSLDVLMKVCDALETTPNQLLLPSVVEIEKSKTDDVLVGKFNSLSPKGQHLCLEFLDWLKDNDL